ncbi:MAG: DUF1003 domain-containing protein [Nanoarchaeota archaeon]|nr:DUF1003 domain-containing protein [Nanoarchaeota archaeon]MBU0962828.1 DUF1003 domain-containing protein [Nanoarchaeota archaeon]
MLKKKVDNNFIKDIRKNKLTLGQKAADIVTGFCGSWTFIISLFVIMAIWMTLNVYLIFFRVWDPYPFILLNFVLSCLAAVEAPIILMSQKRQEQRDRIRSEYDYKVNRKAEREVKQILSSLLKLRKK